MSKTYKDYKANKLYDNRVTEHKSGVKKWWKRLSNKKARRTPLTSTVVDMQYEEKTITIKLPKKVMKAITSSGSSTDKEIEVTITVKTPKYIEVENHPTGLDPWSLD